MIFLFKSIKYFPHDTVIFKILTIGNLIIFDNFEITTLQVFVYVLN